MDEGAGRAQRAFPRQILAAATDLDGTLLRSDETLSCFTRSVLRSLRSSGFPVITATARTPRALRRIVGHEELGVVVCANGSIVWDAASDQVVTDRSFEPATLNEALIRVRSALPAAGLAVLSADTMFIDDAYRRLRGTGLKDAELVDDVTAVAESERIALVAVRHPGIGAAELVDSASVAFGDMPNDLPLLAWAGWACAVQNAHPEVLRAADEVIPRNDDDGVARTLQRLFASSAEPS